MLTRGIVPSSQRSVPCPVLYGIFPERFVPLLSRSLKIVPSDPRDEISVVFILSHRFSLVFILPILSFNNSFGFY